MGRYESEGFGLWAVVLKETGEMIGDCGITMQNIHGQMLRHRHETRHALY